MILLARDTLQYLKGLHEFFPKYLLAETMGSQSDCLSLEDHDNNINHYSPYEYAQGVFASFVDVERHMVWFLEISFGDCCKNMALMGIC